MRIREYMPADFDALRHMHAAQGFGYPLPDLDSPLFILKLVLEEEPNESRARFSAGGLSSGTGFSLSGVPLFGSVFKCDRLKPVPPGRELAGSREEADHKLHGADHLSSTTGHQSPVTSHPSIGAAAPGQAGHPSQGLRASESRVTNHDSQVKMAVLLRLTAEAYLLHDPAAGTPRGRWENFLALHQAALAHPAALGLDDAQAFLPPGVARSFGRRLARLGWVRDPWPCFSRVTSDR